MTRLLLSFLLFTLLAEKTAAQSTRYWPYADPATDSIAGISLYKAYDLLKGRPARKVIVAVIDNGFDIAHEDLAPVIWTNPGEIPGNGIDDDHNGYTDDIHGWNFRSTRDGQLVPDEQAEATHVYERWQQRFAGADTNLFSAAEKQLYQVFTTARKLYEAGITNKDDSTGRLYAYNLHYNSSTLLHDNPEDPYDHHYGSPVIKATESLSHGTHVAGIIGAKRQNGKGIDGVADHLLIMPVIATTGCGDERDKDVANAIRYAVDNGAQLINMSFSKTLSPYKAAVDSAVRYAEKKGVLIFHAAGNDGADDDSLPYYPTATYEDGRKAANFITVGWSRSKFDRRLAHPYSNYGRKNVDLFAPGSDVLSTTPFNTYGSKSGSSMSTPFVTGVAALLLSYFPQLSPAQVKHILLASVFKPATIVNKPGTQQSVTLEQLCVSGGIVNAYNAVKMAIAVSSSKH